MNILDRLTRSNKKEKRVMGNFTQASPRGMSLASAYDFYKGNPYDNAYPSIKAISNAFLQIRPYAIDANGKPLNKTRLTDILARPNKAMSGADFREALAVSALSHRKTYILCWRAENGKALPGGDIRENNLTGFTFLENVAVIYDADGNYHYRVANKYDFSTDEVIEISSGIDPDNLSAGYSPSTAIKKWANVDDYIANYQAGFFENGAVPAGQFIITAGSVEQFNAIVDMMQAKHRGSGANNNVQYVHRPISETGTPQVEQVQWIPFSQPNNSMALGEVFKQTNDKIDSAFGVPASIRGVNENNTYASVKVDEQIFIKYTVQPFATKVWTRFVSELNRITGGLGYGLKFDIDIPNVADEEKVDAERKKTELELILTASQAGFELDSIVDAFSLSNAYKTLKMGSSNATNITNDKPEVDEGGESQDKPSGVVDVPKAKSHTSCSCGEKHSHKAIDANGVSLERDIKRTLVDYYQEFVNKTIDANRAKSKELVPVIEGQEEYDLDGDGYLNEEEIANLMQSFEIVEPTEEDRSKLSTTLLVLLMLYSVKRGSDAQNEEWYKVIQEASTGSIHSIAISNLAKKLNKDISKLTFKDFTNEFGQYKVSETLKGSYGSRLANISLSYSSQVSESIKNVLTNVAKEAEETGRPVRRDVISNKLKESVNLESWRAERIAVTEENHARQLGQIDAIKDLANTIGLNVKKKWLALGSEPCEFCQAMNGTVVDVTKDFVSIGGVIQGVNGGYLQNRYEIMQTAQAHPNCRCKLQFIFEDR